MTNHNPTIKLLRVVVDRWTDDEIVCGEVVVRNNALIPPGLLFQGAVLHLLLSERDADGRFYPQHIVLEPDFLVDVTSICRCFTHHGDVAVMHLLQKFSSSPTSVSILLGNAANQFLDDCINEPDDAASNTETLYRLSLRKTFCADPLRFATTAGIDSQFSVQCRSQFEHIHQVVHEHIGREATLESAFLCPALGIQGRMDLLSTDHRTIVELKSGKADERRPTPSFRYEHALQMALYKESLYYNEGLPYAQVSTKLLYSRYPTLFDIHLGRNDIHRALQLRNTIVHLEHLLCQRPSALLDALQERHFNLRDCHDRFYENYLRPPILHFLQGLHQGTPLARAYFMRMLQFVEREQILAKTGVEGINMPPGHSGFADTWRADRQLKLDAGRLIPDLHLHPIMAGRTVVALEASTTAIDESSNFRVGDTVMLYPQTSRLSPASTYILCVIETLSATSLLLRLRYPQHAQSVEAFTDRTFAIEPSHADAGYTVLYRGLYAFLSLAPRRQQLLLGQRAPEFDTSRSLTLPIEDDRLRDIILRAKQARDYFLLVGPPGTGKTSIALRQMVLEFLASSDNATSLANPDALLLMAFTNRAVDEICAMLSTIQAPYLRLGPELSCAPEHRKHLLTTYAQAHPTRQQIREHLQHTTLFVGTLSSVSSLPELFTQKHFKAAIIDEASQALEPHLLPLLCAAGADGRLAIERFIMIGDHKQLPAVVVQSSAESSVADERLQAIHLTDCRRSLFERLLELAVLHQVPEAIGMLSRQGRMHEAIAAFSNQFYYGGQLQPVPLPHQLAPQQLTAMASGRVVTIHVAAPADECSVKSNHAEAVRVAALVAKLASQLRAAGEALDWQHRLGVIVPFRGQITLVRRALAAASVPESEQITIDTVERFQGSQRDYILFSTTVHASWQLPILSQPVVSDGLLIDRKLNVALTRAREQFILVGNLELLSTCPPYRTFLEYVGDKRVKSEE